MKPTTDWMARSFETFNNKYFNGELTFENDFFNKMLEKSKELSSVANDVVLGNVTIDTLYEIIKNYVNFSEDFYINYSLCYNK